MAMLIIALVLGVLTVARLTRLIVADQITTGVRRWVVTKWGAESMPSYFIHCPWCMSIWLSPIAGAAALFPNRWVIGALALGAASYLTGLLSQLEAK
jgi:hypothetical protein